jgi:hypothetical protein
MQINQAQQILQTLNPTQRAAINALNSQKRVTSYPYYSKVRFHADQSGQGPFTYVIAQGTVVRAFSYARDAGNANTAGFPANMVATAAETNLAQAGMTISGETVHIKGICCQVIHGLIDDDEDNQLFTDWRLVAQLSECVSAEMSLNGNQNLFQLGVLGMIPSGGGMFGAGIDTLGTQNLEGGRPIFHMGQNGWAVSSNAAWLPEGLQWRNASKQDSMLNVRLVVQREITMFSGGLIDITADDEDAAALIRGYVYPAEIGATFMFHLKGTSVGPRSDSA